MWFEVTPPAQFHALCDKVCSREAKALCYDPHKCWFPAALAIYDKQTENGVGVDMAHLGKWASLSAYNGGSCVAINMSYADQVRAAC